MSLLDLVSAEVVGDAAEVVGDADGHGVAPDPARETGAIAWLGVCRGDDIGPGLGVCALVGRCQVAIFRSAIDGTLSALDNTDPFSGAPVMSRGLLGTVGEAAVVSSPMFKQRFDLATGVCVDDVSVTLTVHPVREVAGWVQIGVPVPLVAAHGAVVDGD